MKRIFMQDKRARKQIPAVGTKKYPIYYLGIGEERNGKIKTNGRWPYGIVIHPENYRFYVVGKRSAKWLENVSVVEMGHYFHNPDIPEY